MAEPAYSFTLPSLEDNLTLECRIYHPESITASSDDGSAGVRGATLAHPYAPLGGCLDDPVVLSLTETLLGEGYIVGTFNFRGAGGSQGRTSWSGRGETEDYSTVAGFMIYYLHHLGSGNDADALAITPSGSNGLAHQSASSVDRRSSAIHLLLGGYSYGSLVLARLPTPASIIKRLQEAAVGTAAAEIILRSRTLAKQTLQSIRAAKSPAKSRGRTLKAGDAGGPASPTQHARALPVTVGGEEMGASERRRSRDSRRSIDIVRKNIEVPQRIKAHIRLYSSKHQQDAMPESESSVATARDGAAPVVKACYLLISPVLLPFTNILCPPGPPVPSLSLRKRAADGSAGALFLQHPTLALFGTTDAFTSSRRLRAWAEKQAQASHTSDFTWLQIDGAGHFWREDGVMQTLQERVISWPKSTWPSS